MNINGEEILLIAFLAVVLIGPERLPQYAEQLARLIKNLKKLATGAKETLKDELGDDLSELAKFDPRQYDPRRIVRDALIDDVIPASRPASAAVRVQRTAAVAESATSTVATGAVAATGVAAAAGAGLPIHPGELSASEEPGVGDRLEAAMTRAAQARREAADSSAGENSADLAGVAESTSDGVPEAQASAHEAEVPAIAPFDNEAT